MTKRKEKSPLEFTQGNAKRYLENVRRTFGDTKARHRGEDGRFEKDRRFE